MFSTFDHPVQYQVNYFITQLYSAVAVHGLLVNELSQCKILFFMPQVVGVEEEEEKSSKMLASQQEKRKSKVASFIKALHCYIFVYWRTFS